MTFFEELEKNTQIIKALGSEILNSSANDETIMKVANIVGDTVYMFKRAKEVGLTYRQSYSRDALKFAKDDIKTLKKIYSEAYFEQLEKNIEKDYKKCWQGIMNVIQ